MPYEKRWAPGLRELNEERAMLGRRNKGQIPTVSVYIPGKSEKPDKYKLNLSPSDDAEERP